MEFPRKRFERVGATVDELDEMEAMFDASSEAAQKSLVDRIAPMPDSALTLLLEERRETDDAPPASAPVAEPAPAPSQSASSSASKASDSTSQSSS